jgi:hypothetical protein
VKSHGIVRIGKVVVSVMGLFWIAVFGLTAVLRAMVFDGFEADGPFQLYNPLRRIAAGQRGGVDFQFFHGLGVPYLHYPIFRLLGGSIFASELSRQILSPALFLGTTFFFFWTLTGDRRRTWILAALAVGALIEANGIFLPAGSILGVRSAMPIATVAVMLIELSPLVAGMLAGACLGMATWLGVEQGLAITVAWLAVQGVILVARHERRATAVRIAAALVCLVVVITILHAAPGGVAGMRAALNYELRIVPADQFWYFGVPPNAFLTSWRQLVTEHSRVLGYVTISLYVWLLALAAVLRTSSRLAAPLATLLTYGLLSCVSFFGIAAEMYFQPLERALVFTLLAFLALNGRGLARRLFPRIDADILIGPSMILVGAYGLSVIASYQAFHLPGLLEEWRRSPRMTEPRLSKKWTNYLTTARQLLAEAHVGARPLVWSTYSGLLEGELGEFNPSFDYMIHALGPANRAAYVRTFHETRPPIVQTIRRRFQFEEWLQNENWEFYEELIRHYQFVGRTEHSLFWKRAEVSIPVLYTARLPARESLLTVPLPPLGPAAEIAVVEVRYSVVNPWSRVPFVGTWPRYFVQVDPASGRIPVSLPPGRSSFRFAVFRGGSLPLQLAFSSASLLPGAALIAHEVSVQLLSLPQGSEALFTDPYAGGARIFRRAGAGVPGAARPQAHLRYSHSR